MENSHKTCMEQEEFIDRFGTYQPRTSPATISASLTPTCISWSPAGSITLVSSPSEICCYATSQPSTWGNQRGEKSHQLSFDQGYVCHDLMSYLALLLIIIVITLS